MKCLKEEGVDTLFGYPGGAVIPLYDALYDCDDFLNIRTCHEQGAVHSADGYARSSGKVGVCIATSGPGATNTITGIATAYMDSIPLIVITGQVGTSLLGKDSFQEIDVTGLTMGITKHNYLVKKSSDIGKVISEAFFVAKDKRPGPVLIDISKDAFLEEVHDTTYEKLYQTEDLRHFNYESEIENLAIAIKKSKNPVIYAGGGVLKSSASYNLRLFAKKLNIPVVNSIMGLGSFDRNSPLSYGIVGMHGDSEANLLCYESDLIIAIGVRFSDRAIGNRNGFCRNGDIAHIDVDATELKKNIDSKYNILGDFNLILESLMRKLKNHKPYKNLEEKSDTKEYMGFHPKKILETIQENLPQNTIVATDVGQHQIWTSKYWKFHSPLTFITSGGLGTMGFGMGGALGAKVANPDSNVVLITGDGSFRMNHNELLTLRHYNIPVTVVLFNNSSLGMVRQWQGLFCNKRYSSTSINDALDVESLCKAYGVNYHRADDLDSLKASLSSINPMKDINLIECIIDKDTGVYPIVPPGKSIDNVIEC